MATSATATTTAFTMGPTADSRRPGRPRTGTQQRNRQESITSPRTPPGSPHQALRAALRVGHGTSLKPGVPGICSSFPSSERLFLRSESVWVLGSVPVIAGRLADAMPGLIPVFAGRSWAFTGRRFLQMPFTRQTTMPLRLVPTFLIRPAFFKARIHFQTALRHMPHSRASVSWVAKHPSAFDPGR